MEPGAFRIIRMAKINKSELEKLSPAERIKKLKRLERENKKEIVEAEDLIKKTEAEIQREKITESVNIPETKTIDISQLFAPTESALEQAAEGAREMLTEDNVRYFVQNAYEGIKEVLYGEMDNESMMEKIDAIGEKLEKVKYMHVSSEIANLAVASIGMIYKMRKDQREA